MSRRALRLSLLAAAVVVAAIAVVLFQRPPLNILLRRAKLEVEAYSTLALFRKLVNPNAQLNLIITNTGGRRIKIAPKRKLS